MKKILFLLLLSVSIYGQTLQNPTFGNTTTNTLKIKTPATVTSVNFLTAFDVDGISVAKIDPINLPLSDSSKNYIDSKIPTNYSKIVYVNATNPNSATIFDLNNPPITNDNLLKNDTNNLYIGTDASTWVYNGSVYVTKTVTSATSNFNYFGTSTDAGNSKTASIERSGNINTTGRLTVGTDVPTETNIRVNRPITGAVSSNSILIDGVIKSDVTNSAFLNKTIARTEALSFTLPNLYHNYTSQGIFGAGSAVTNQYGFYTDASMIEATNNYGFYGNIPSGTNRWNLYMNGTAPNYFNGGVYIGSTSQIGKLLVVTGTANAINISSQPSASVVMGNLGTGGNEMPVVSGKTSNNTGLTLMAASSEVNTTPDMRFEIRENDNSDFTDRTTAGFRFTRYGTNLVEILRNGNTTFIGKITASPATVDSELATLGQVKSVARPYKVYVAKTTLTSSPVTTVSENNSGGTISWARTGIGTYVATISGATFPAKTDIFHTCYNENTLNFLRWVVTSTTITITTYNQSATVVDSNNTLSIEIRFNP